MTLSTLLWLAGAAGVVLALGVGWPRRKGRRNGRRVLGGALLVALAGLALLGAMLLREYQWLRTDVPVARVALRQLGSQSFEATLSSGTRPPRVLPLHGDEWQLDARMVRLPALPPLVRLERLAGHYGDPKQEDASPRDSHDLRGRWDFWQAWQRTLGPLPIAQSRWGSATAQPMLDGATFDVFVDAYGALVVKPADAETGRLLREAGW